MSKATTDSTGIYSDMMNASDCRITICFKGKCKTIYIADGDYDMVETAQEYAKELIVELDKNALGNQRRV